MPSLNEIENLIQVGLCWVTWSELCPEFGANSEPWHDTARFCRMDWSTKGVLDVLTASAHNVGSCSVASKFDLMQNYLHLKPKKGKKHNKQGLLPLLLFATLCFSFAEPFREENSSTARLADGWRIQVQDVILELQIPAYHHSVWHDFDIPSDFGSAARSFEGLGCRPSFKTHTKCHPQGFLTTFVTQINHVNTCRLHSTLTFGATFKAHGFGPPVKPPPPPGTVCVQTASIVWWKACRCGRLHPHPADD